MPSDELADRREVMQDIRDFCRKYGGDLTGDDSVAKVVAIEKRARVTVQEACLYLALTNKKADSKGLIQGAMSEMDAHELTTDMFQPLLLKRATDSLATVADATST